MGARAGRGSERAHGRPLTPTTPIWYAGYGSNLDADRFRSYLHGGRPRGAARTYPGARDPADPLDVRPFRMPGELVFAWESPTWGGGIAFHEPDAGGEVLARAYLLTRRQLADVLEQEMRREPGADHDLSTLLETGRQVLGPGRYETLRVVGALDGRPVVSFGCADARALGVRAPAPAYLTTVARGLRSAHGLTDGEIAAYLLACPGMVPEWTAERLAELLSDV